MANLSVSYEDIRTAARQLQSGQAEIESQLSTLKCTVDNLINGGFVTDQASVAFGQSYDEFNNGVKQVVEGLTGMSSYLTNASESMSEMDSQLAQAIRK